MRGLATNERGERRGAKPKQKTWDTMGNLKQNRAKTMRNPKET